MNKKNHKLSLDPFVHMTPSIETTALFSIVFLLPQLIMLYLTKSYNSLFIILSSVIACVLSEFICNSFLKRRRFNATSVLEGIIVGMFFPSTYPIFLVFVVVFCSITVVKHFFGGLAASWVNPLCVTIVIAWFAGSKFFPPFFLTADMLETSNAVPLLFSSNVVPLSPIDVSVTEKLNSTILKYLGIVLPEGYVTLFWDTQSVIPAFRFNFLTLIASILLIAFNMCDFIVSLIFLVVYSILVRIFGSAPFAHIFGSGDILLALLTSGTLFCAFFLLNGYGTLPMTIAGKIVYGILAGAGAFLICGCGMSPIGSVFLVIVMNTISPFIQLIEDKIFMIFKVNELKVRLENER